MTNEEIRDLIDAVIAAGIAELEVQRGENRVWIKRTGGMVTQEIHVPAAAVGAPSHNASAVTPTPVVATPLPAAPKATQAEGEPDLTDPTLKPVTSPIVGTFYEASSPDAAPFVRPGDAISPGKVVCIIESMKLMNEIEAEISGTIVKQLVDNGQPVEYGQVLYLVKPN
jgi:acetyl-CoA carboxylase biotin carboxyl carrier protein